MIYYQREKAVALPWVMVALIVLVSVVVCVGAWQKAARYQAHLEACRQETGAQVAVETKKAVADIEEKYSADRISYEVMARRMAEMTARAKATETDKK